MLDYLFLARKWKGKIFYFNHPPIAFETCQYVVWSNCWQHLALFFAIYNHQCSVWFLSWHLRINFKRSVEHLKLETEVCVFLNIKERKLLSDIKRAHTHFLKFIRLHWEPNSESWEQSRWKGRGGWKERPFLPAKWSNTDKRWNWSAASPSARL